MKKYAAVLTCLSMLFLFTLCGCSGENGRLCKNLQASAQLTKAQSGGVMQIQSSSSESDDMKLTFRYLYDADGVMHYCVEQFDSTDRRLFLEYHDGELIQQWLLGHGSSTIDQTSSRFVRYTKETPYKYIPMVCTIPDEKAVTGMTAEQKDGATVYTLTLDPEKVGGEASLKEPLSSRTVAYEIGKDGMISRYTESSVYTDKDGAEKSYTLDVSISELGKISEVTLPAIE